MQVFKPKILTMMALFLMGQMAFAEAVNSAPSITSTPITSTNEDSLYTYAMGATDANNDALTWSVVSKPDWLTLTTNGSSEVTTFVDGFSNTPKGIGYNEATGDIYIASDDNKIYKVTSSGEKLEFAAIASMNYGNMIIYNGELYVSLYGGSKIVKYDISDTSGTATATTVADSGVGNPIGLALKDDYLYVALRAPYKVVKLNLSSNLPITPEDVITNTDNALVDNLFGLTFDDAGNLYMTTWNKQSVVKYDGANITTHIENIGNSASDIKIDNQGNFYISTDGGGVKKYSSTLDTNSTISDGLHSWGMTITNAGTLIMGDSILNTDYSSYRVVKLETGAILSGTPTNDDVGVHEIKLTVSDGVNSVDHDFTLTVNNVNDAPTITGGNKTFTVNEDTQYNLDLTVTDVDSSELSWIIKTQGSNGTASVEGSGTSKSVSYIPNADFVGTDSFEVEVSDGMATNTITVTVTVDAVNDAPTITSSPTLSVAQGDKYTYEVSATDKENDSIEFDVTTDASWLSLASEGFDFTKIAGGNGYYYWNSSDNGDGGLATDAKIYGYGDIVKRSNGDIYFTEYYSIRKINASDGTISTVAGTGDTSYYTYSSDYAIEDGVATEVNLTNASVMSINPDDDEIYFAECGVVRKFDESANTVTTVVGKNSYGCGYYGGSANYEDRYNLDANSWQNSNLSYINDLKFDNSGNMYVKDSFSLVKFSKDGTVSTITKRDYKNSYSSSNYTYFNEAKNANEVGTNELQINYFDVNDSGVIYFMGYTYKQYTTSWGTSYYSIPILGKIENGIITKIKDLDNFDNQTNNEYGYYYNSVWYSGLEIGNDGNIYSMSNEWDYEDNFDYYYYGTQKSYLVKFNSDGTELDKIEIKDNNDYVYISNFSMSDNFDFYYFNYTNNGAALMKIAQKSISLSGIPTCKDVGTFNVAVKASDVFGATTTQNFALEVTNVNDKPVFENSSAVVAEGSALESLVTTLQASDCDISDTLTYSILSGNNDNDFSIDANSGKVSVAGNISILNKQSYLLEVQATDESGESDSAYLTVAVADADLVPIAVNDEVTTNEENSITINVLENDSDGDNNIDILGVSIVKQPTNGKATVQNDGTIVYVPNKDFYGEDTIIYTVKDKTNLVSNEANITVIVNNVNDNPIAVSDVIQTPEDVPVIFLPIENDEDADGKNDLVSMTITTSPTNGEFTISNGEVTYTPNLDFYGTDSFEYTVTDSNGITSEVVKSYITVAEVNDIPVANDDTMETNEDVNVTFAVLDNDIDDHSIVKSADSVEIIKNPKNGTLSKEADGSITYAPNLNFYGQDSFEYAVYDNNFLMSLPTTVKITVNPINDVPVAIDDSYTIDEDTIATLNILSNDVDVENKLTSDITITLEPQNGEVKVLDDGKILYVPKSNYNGTDNFKYSVNDEEGAVSNTATVNITITPVDDLPVLSSFENQNITEDGNNLSISIVSGDSDGDEITYEVSTNDSSIATAQIVDGKIVVTPMSNASGIVTVELNATANGQTVTQSFTVAIESVNDVPTFTTTLNENANINEDSAEQKFELNANDFDGDTLTITLESSDPTILTVTPSWTENLTFAQYSNQPLEFTLTPQENMNGEVEITINATDGTFQTQESFTINVVAVNDEPTLSTFTDLIVYKNFNDITYTLPSTDVDEDILSYEISFGNSDIVQSSVTDNVIVLQSIDGKSGLTDVTITVNDEEYSTSKTFSLQILSFEDGDGVEEQGTVNKETDDNGTEVTTISVPQNNLTVKTEETTSGTVSHEVTLGDKTVTAVSQISGSTTQLVEDGVKTVFEDTTVKAEVNATITGQATHTLTKDGKTTTAESKFVGAQTVIKQDTQGVSIETSVNIDTITSIKVIAKEDGSAEHIVQKDGKSSTATSSVAGAHTTIDETGSVDTSVGTNAIVETGKVLQAVVITDTNGETQTKFRLVDTATGTEENSVPTLANDQKFPIGTNVNITEDSSGKTHIQATTPVLDTDMSFEIK